MLIAGGESKSATIGSLFITRFFRTGAPLVDVEAVAERMHDILDVVIVEYLVSASERKPSRFEGELYWSQK